MPFAGSEDNQGCVIRKVEEVLGKPVSYELKKYILREFENAEKTFECALRDIEKAGSSEELLLGFMEFTNTLQLVLRDIIDNAWKKFRIWLKKI